MQVLQGDCIKVMAAMGDASIDAVVTDPPYSLGFMAKSWDTHDDYQDWSRLWARECLRVLKPGGHLLAFGGTRTYHRMACAIEDAGFEIRDSLHWIYGQGFPKSLDISKAIDKAAGAQREVTGINEDYLRRKPNGMKTAGASVYGYSELQHETDARITAPATDAARQWEGWGTGLKPSHEIVICARKMPAYYAFLEEIGSRLDLLEQQWSQTARNAAGNSAPTHRGSPEEKGGSVSVNAVTVPEGERERKTPTGKAGGSSAATDTFPSGWTAETCSNIVTSWRKCWAELCDLTSMSTIEITSRTIIDLKTLSSCLDKITVMNTQALNSRNDGRRSLVTAADNLFVVVLSSLRAILALSAGENATDSTLRNYLDADAEPAHEPVVLARKPFTGTVAANVIEHGTGALNIGGCRVGPGGQLKWAEPRDMGYHGGSDAGQVDALESDQGRWPPNVLLDEEVAAELDLQSGHSSEKARVLNRSGARQMDGWGLSVQSQGVTHDDSGGASRFFPVFRYQAKANRNERPRLPDGTCHATVKPVALMRWLVRLITPAGAVVLDPFAGTGTTGEACLDEGRRCILIEREPDYIKLIRARLDARQPTLWDD